MKPLYLYIENFQCHEKSEIDFSSFNCALLIGKVDNNELIANGVGKSSIFKAIEYVLFNQVRDPLLSKDIVLEDLIRDDSEKVSVIFDFSFDQNVYRVIRMRTRKGISDLSLYKKIDYDKFKHNKETSKEFWENISGRRTSDTEGDLIKIIKINYKAFINTVHFMQSDMSGLATATPEKRKNILKESLELLIFSKLEKIAKAHADSLLKNLDKNNILIDSLADPNKDIGNFLQRKKSIENEINQEIDTLNISKISLESIIQNNNELNSKLGSLEASSNNLISLIASLDLEVKSLDQIFLDQSKKKKNLLLQAQSIASDLKSFQDERKKLEQENFFIIPELKINIEKYISGVSSFKTSINNLKNELEELKIPMPSDGSCKHCRQILTEAHRHACQLKINQDIFFKEKELINLNQLLVNANLMQKETAEILKGLEIKQKKFNEILILISSKEKELNQSKLVFEDLTALVKATQDNLQRKKDELKKVQSEAELSSIKEINICKEDLIKVKQSLINQKSIISELEVKINKLKSEQAIIDHSLSFKENDLKKKEQLTVESKLLQDTYEVYPLVIQAFGSTGIPNAIIQNVLDDYQDEANKLLSEIRPGLQLAFNTEKTKKDGSLDDTLELNYFLNNKARGYSQLSGAQRLCIAFSLKLGFAFLLNKMTGSKINLLLLDEIDQSLDKASTDAFAKIIKHFQNNFTILVITHNDRMKNSFGNFIIVEQDQNMVSKAYVEGSC